MKWILVSFLCVASLPAKAQDLIVLRDEVEIIARITEVHRYYILYQPFADLNSEPKRLTKNDISYIIYEGGMKQHFSPDGPPPGIFEEVKQVVMLPEYVYLLEGESIDREMYNLGLEDAQEHFRLSYPFWVTMFMTTALPVLGGIVTGVIISSVSPNINPLKTPDPTLFKVNPSYRKGYLRKVKSKKTDKAVGGFVAGAGVLLLIVILSATN